MAAYQKYPTPPPTSSPKHSANYQSQSYDYPEPSPFSQPQPLPNPQSQTNAPPKIPAQDSYFHSYSAPSSPVQYTIPSSSNPQHRPSKPSRYQSSPLLSGPAGIQYTQPTQAFSPRPFSPSQTHRLSPRPLHYSPVNPVPSPYSAGRPKPRAGFLRRIAMKLEAWIKGFMRWSRKNPMLAGVLTFVPVMTIAGVIKITRGLGKGLGLVQKGYARPDKVEGSGTGKKGLDREEDWGWGLDEFKGVGGTKGGPLEGMLKILHMLVNHWGKFTPSAYPRAASLLMELYFLDAK